MEMIEAVKDALLTDLRTRYGALVNDPTLDIGLIVPTTFNKQTRAPQIILTDFITVPYAWQSNGTILIEEDREEGTVQEVNEPIHRNIEFAVTAVAKTSRAAERMAEVLMVYFGGEKRLLEFSVGDGEDAFTFKFLKEIAAEFRDATQPNDGALFFHEGRARIVDVPIYDGQRLERYLAKTVTVDIEDMTGTDELASVVVEAGE
jgi:hypothetical protein